jgi:hypothetical protein
MYDAEEHKPAGASFSSESGMGVLPSETSVRGEGDQPEYPPTPQVVAVMIAICLSIFLVALVIRTHGKLQSEFC